MMASKAAIEYIETHKVAKNYLDFQLATYLGFLIGKGKKVRFTSSARIPGLTVLSISGAEETSKPSASQALLPLPLQGCFFKKGNLHKEKEEKIGSRSQRIKKRDERGKRDKRNCGKKEAGKEKTSGSNPQKNTNGIKR